MHHRTLMRVVWDDAATSTTRGRVRPGVSSALRPRRAFGLGPPLAGDLYLLSMCAKYYVHTHIPTAFRGGWRCREVKEV